MTEQMLVNFFREVDRSFPIPLSEKVNINQYAQKLLEYGTLCVKIKDDAIQGLVGGYTENVEEKRAYISVVAVLSSCYRQGVASKLVREFIEQCREKQLQSIHLYTHKNNTGAIEMYRRIGFQEYILENETRQEDLHLIYYL